MRYIIQLIQLLDNLKMSCDVITTTPKGLYGVFADNRSCITVVELKKLPARTKHITIKYYHFSKLDS